MPPAGPATREDVRLAVARMELLQIDTIHVVARSPYLVYVLPIHRRGVLVGRLDAKAHRPEGLFEVKALYLEPGTAVGEGLLRDLARAIASCAAWHGTPGVRIAVTAPPGVRRAPAGLLRAGAHEMGRGARDAR